MIHVIEKECILEFQRIEEGNYHCGKLFHNKMTEVGMKLFERLLLAAINHLGIQKDQIENEVDFNLGVVPRRSKRKFLDEDLVHNMDETHFSGNKDNGNSFRWQ